MGAMYSFKNFTELTEQESDEVLQGRNDAEVRRWMTSDRIITPDEHRRFMESLRRNDKAVYVRIERAGCFAGVYSLNDIADGSALGGFWVSSYTRERLLALNVVFHGMDYMFRTFGIGRIYGCQRAENHGAIRLNALLGLNRCGPSVGCGEGMEQIEITRTKWEQNTAQDPKLIKLMDRAERLSP
jgi:RimJ/RimL family protein N-acetyltransferase